MSLKEVLARREQFLRENTQEKFDARVKAKAEELFPESWRKEVADAVIASFMAQVSGF